MSEATPHGAARRLRARRGATPHGRHRATAWGAMAVLALCAGPSLAGPDTTAAAEIHGVADAFARPGVALAWGIVRGKTEADTIVIVRVETTAPDLAFVAADGIDPFTRQRKAIHGPTRADPRADLRFPRAHFGDYPRTEFRFTANEKSPSGLTIYYLGVPDTTPEFATQEALGRYLDDRLERERRSSAK